MSQIGVPASGIDQDLAIERLLLREDSDMFLHVVPKKSQTPVKGEGRSVGDWETPMPILGWRWAEGQGSGRGTAGSSVTDLQVADLAIVKRIDAGSPVLGKLCASGEPLSLVAIKCMKTGSVVKGQPQWDYLQLQCEDAFIRTFQIFTSSMLGQPVEVIGVSMQRLKLVYARQLESGGRGAEVSFALDVPARKPI